MLRVHSGSCPFQLEPCCDHVLIYDGTVEDGVFLEALSASAVDPTDSWRAESGIMTVRMESDGSISGDSGYNGFLARVVREEPE